MLLRTAFGKGLIGIDRIVLFGLLNLIPIINFFSMGYLARVIKDYKAGELPPIKGTHLYFFKGILIFLINVIWMLPATIVFIIALGFSEESIFLFSVFKTPVLLILAVVLGIFAAYNLPAAIITYALTGKFSNAFRFLAVFRRCFSFGYFKIWLFGLVLLIGSRWVTRLLPFWVASVLTAIITFYIGVVFLLLLTDKVAKR